MIKDPCADGHGPLPYDVLTPVGVTPWTTHRDMQDVSFELLARHLMTPATQQAWDALRSVRRRILVDLFLYDVDLAAELPLALAGIDSALAAEPVPQDPPPGTLPEPAARLLADLIRFDV